MSDYNNNETTKAIEKAVDALRTAEHDLKGGFLLASVNRAYYTCYYCMTALLYTKNVYAKTHQGTRSKFAELFIKTELFPIHVSEIISLLFDNRQEADYDLDADITREEAESLIKISHEFLSLTKRFLNI
jgi:uncharacterized protein (UPF0332 family)